MAQAETDLLRSVHLQLGRLEGVTVWRNDCGVVKHERRVVRYGLCPGSADLIGIIAPEGRFLAVEIKTARGKVSAPQQRFLDLIEAHGGIAAVVRSQADAPALLARLRGRQKEQHTCRTDSKTLPQKPPRSTPTRKM